MNTPTPTATATKETPPSLLDLAASLGHQLGWWFPAGGADLFGLEWHASLEYPDDLGEPGATVYRTYAHVYYLVDVCESWKDAQESADEDPNEKPEPYSGFLEEWILWMEMGGHEVLCVNWKDDEKETFGVHSWGWGYIACKPEHVDAVTQYVAEVSQWWNEP